MIPNFIGGPLCGKELAAGDELPDEVDIEGIGVYERLSVVPAWLVDIPFKPNNPVYLWQQIYHNAEGKAA